LAGPQTGWMQNQSILSSRGDSEKENLEPAREWE
jgi:hypothetical protein